jgi:hypothetical protein
MAPIALLRGKSGAASVIDSQAAILGGVGVFANSSRREGDVCLGNGSGCH